MPAWMIPKVTSIKTGKVTACWIDSVSPRSSGCGVTGSGHVLGDVGPDCQDHRTSDRDRAGEQDGILSGLTEAALVTGLRVPQEDEDAHHGGAELSELHRSAFH